MELSFTSMLFMVTWCECCGPTWPFRGLVSSRLAGRLPGDIELFHELERADAFLTEHGWTRHPLSSRWLRLFECEGAVAYPHQWYGVSSLVIEVRTRHESDRDRILAELARALDLRISPHWR